MAIQNFLSGGYYGKLGATVGQRWKNKRTIRTYVVPANPRTPTQQANRGKFADAVTYAQMGMQMNYYCTLFDDPNFTKWNYRMKVARALKNAGLSELDLIPLYPISFNPPILLTEFRKATVTGQKHISFATPNLALNVDRVLSIMFALYNEQDTFLGYKLYLGYYYAANPGYVEVDVDDVMEINTHCFVRIISNDDEDSATDLIGSPRLALDGGSIDVHTFDKTIRNLQKSTTGITITFGEPWKGVPVVNKINFNLACVTNGESVNLNGENLELFENNGYCAVRLPYAAWKNQMLPAFPVGSGIENLTVDYEGESWHITIRDANEAYDDNDLTRSITNSITWNTADTGDITFKVAFNGSVTASTKNFNMVCSGRLLEREAENQSFNVVGDGTNLIFTCTGSRKHYPMMNPGDLIFVTAQSFICNGVTYNLAAQDIALRNAIETSYYLEGLEWTFGRDGGGSTGDDLQYLEAIAYIENASHAEIYNGNAPLFSYVEVIPGIRNCVPFASQYILSQDGSDLYISFKDEYYESLYCDQTQDSNNVIVEAAPSIPIDGVTYTFSRDWIAQNFPTTLEEWEV